VRRDREGDLGGGLRASLTASSHLPSRPTPLIGRQRELHEICEQLRRPEVRLLTLTGPPGVGKTRLAAEAAHELRDAFDDGVFFVRLAPVRDPRVVLATAARTLGIREVGIPVLEQLKRALSSRRLLFILDNFEHLTQAAAQVEGLLTGCPHVAVLATSRAPIHLRWEREFPVDPLELPDLKGTTTLKALAQNPAVALFFARARAIRPDFTMADHGEEARLVAEICHRLDGLPLAIELAAARIRVLSPKAIHERLVGSAGPAGWHLLRATEVDVEARHRTLEDAIAWSYRLLSPQHRRLFRQLAVFSGGCTLEAAQAICGDDAADADMLEGLHSLVDHSLLRREVQSDSQPRFTMLQTIKEFALRRLQNSGEEDTARRRHATHLLELAEQAEPHMWDQEQVIWLDRLEIELDNLRATLDWCTKEGDPDLGLRLAGASFRFWDLRGYWSEGRQRIKHMLEVFARRSPDRVRLLLQSTYLALVQGDLEAAQVHLDDAHALACKLNDTWSIAFSLVALGGGAALIQGDVARAQSLLVEAERFSRKTGEKYALAAALQYQATVAHARGDYSGAEAIADNALPLIRQNGDRHHLLITLLQHGLTALARGTSDVAQRSFKESLQLAVALGETPMIAVALEAMGWAMMARGNDIQAASFLGAADALRENLGASEIGPPLPTWYVYRKEIARRIEALRGLETVANSWAEGRQMSLEVAIEKFLSVGAPGKHKEEALAGSPLTSRENEVAGLVAQGFSNREIAIALHVSRRTVESHVQHILNKFGFRSRAQIASWTTGQRLAAGRH